jgi:hypothetical protein
VSLTSPFTEAAEQLSLTTDSSHLQNFSLSVTGQPDFRSIDFHFITTGGALDGALDFERNREQNKNERRLLAQASLAATHSDY